MLEEKDIDMSTAPIDMPPLGYEVGAEPSEPVDSNELPPEIRQAQDLERQAIQPQEEEQQQPKVVQQYQNEQEVMQARNFKALKEAAERAARERDDLARRLQEYENTKLESPDEDFNINEEDIVEGKHLAKAIKRIKQLEQQQKQYMRQNSETAAEMKLRAQYPDFDKVMTYENVQMLSASYPELAKSINASTDLYDKAASAYTIIKKFGIYSETPNESEKKRVAANTSKPRPATSVSPQQGDSPLSRANAFSDGLTEQLKEQLRKEMDMYASQY